jgi:hypothetical protein
MVAQGVTPPNVRTDIDDTPPDPTRPPSQPAAQVGVVRCVPVGRVGSC